MKLSIVIPVYRVESTIDRCVQSVVSQTFCDFEVILVDDGSPDRSPTLCDLWAQRDGRITVVHQPNGGLSAARNAGIERARGEYITFIDSDDYIADDTLQQVMDVADGNDLTEYPVWQYYGAPHQSVLMLDDRVYDNADDYWLQAQAYCHCYAPNKVFRRSLFQTVRFPTGRLFEDVYTLPLLLRQARRIATTTKGLYYYCWNGHSITATAEGYALRQLLDAHLTALMPIDDRYYYYLLNIQIDVCEQTGDEPRLPVRRLQRVGSVKQKLKTIALNILGINGLCKVSKLLHKVRKPSRS